MRHTIVTSFREDLSVAFFTAMLAGPVDYSVDLPEIRGIAHAMFRTSTREHELDEPG
jgi:hypothetical protein